MSPGIKINYALPALPQTNLTALTPASIPVPIPRNQAESAASLAGRAVPHFLLELSDVELEGFKNFIEILTLQASKEPQAPFLTNGATSTEDQIANISYFIRTLMPESIPTESIGVTTGENVFQGAWAAYKALARYKKAVKIEDSGGKLEGAVDVIRGANQSIGGAAYLGYRGTMIASQIKGVDTSIKATTVLGRSAYVLGVIGNVFFGIFYVMIGIWASYGFVKDWQFSLAMKAHENDDAALFDFLTRKVNVDPRDKLKKLNTSWRGLPVREKLADVALDKFSNQFLKMQKELKQKGELNGRALSKDEIKNTFKLLFKHQEAKLCEKGVKNSYLSILGLEANDLETTPLSTLELIGLALEESRRQSKKEAKFSRVTSGASLEAVKKAVKGGLKERLGCNSDVFVQEAAKKELGALKNRVTLENKKHKWTHALMVTFAILGLTSMIVGFFSLPPVGATALIVVTLLLCGFMMLTDGHAMLKGWESGTVPGRADKPYLIAISLVILAALALSIGATLGFGLPILPLILASVIAGMGLALSGVAYYKLTQKEKRWKEDHPDLSVFSSLPLQEDQELDQKTTGLFKKLPKADRLAIRAQYEVAHVQREWGFKRDRYRALESKVYFGQAYMQMVLNHPEVKQDHELLISALKKTVKCFWESAARTKSENDRVRALKMQGLLERVKQKKTLEIVTKFNEIRSDYEAYLRLDSDIRYVVKRHESLQDLKQAIDKVSQLKAQIVPQVDSRPHLISLVQRVCA